MPPNLTDKENRGAPELSSSRLILVGSLIFEGSGFGRN